MMINVAESKCVICNEQIIVLFAVRALFTVIVGQVQQFFGLKRNNF